MAGDWIKMRMDLSTSPKVVRIASALNADRLRVVGGLHAVWCLFDVHSEDGRLDGYTLAALDDLIGFEGFADAMVSVGWLVDGGDFLCTPRFDEHNGQSAKRRAMETERKRESRKVSAPDADKKRSREEKRREEITKEQTHTATAPQERESNFEKQKPTAPALAAMAMKRGGIGAVSPSHPELLAMVNAGVTAEQFQQAAEAAVLKSKGFPYALGILKGQLREANALTSEGLSMPAKPWDESRTSIEAEGERLGLGKWDESKWSVGQGKSFAEYANSVKQAREQFEVA